MAVNQLKSGVVLTYVQMFLGNIISLIYTPVMLRMLGQNEYGLISLSASVVMYLSLLTLGLSGSFIRFNTRARAAGDRQGEYNLNGMYLVVYAMISVVTLLAGIVLAFNAQNIFGAKLLPSEAVKVRTMIILLASYSSFFFATSVFSLNIDAYQRFFFSRAVSIVNTIINPIIQLPLLFLGCKSVGLTVASTLTGFFTIGLNVFYCIKFLKIKIRFNAFDLCLMKGIFIFSSFVLINMVADTINWNVDKLLLGMFIGPASVAVYAIGSQFNIYYMSFSTSISSVFIPKVNLMEAESADNGALCDLMTRIGRIQFFVLSLILSGFIFFGRPFIMFWAGQNYEQSYYIGLLLIVPITIPLIQNVGVEIQKAKNRHKFRSILYGGIAVGNLLMSIPLCRLYGGIGCAIGTGIALLIGDGVIMNIYYQRFIGLDMIKFWKEIIMITPAFVLPVCAGILSMMFFKYTSLWILMLFGAAYVVIFCASMWLLGLNGYEKRLFGEPVQRSLHRLKSAAASLVSGVRQ